MGYWIALVVGVFIGFMGIMGLIAMGLDIGPGGRDVDPGPLRAVIPLVISAALISISILGLRKRKGSEHPVDDTDLDNDEID